MLLVVMVVFLVVRAFGVVVVNDALSRIIFIVLFFVFVVNVYWEMVCEGGEGFLVLKIFLLKFLVYFGMILFLIYILYGFIG